MKKNKKVLIDANYFCALNNVNDALFKKAKNLAVKLADKNYRILTLNYIVSEALTVLSLRVGKKAAVNFGRKMFNNQRIQILRVSDKEEKEAFKIFLKVKNKNFSFVDAVILQILKDEKIDYLLTFDKQLKRQAKKRNHRTLK
jgi:predicted nucleic acid-binding protein